jgi:hypothetical protein
VVEGLESSQWFLKDGALFPRTQDEKQRATLLLIEYSRAETRGGQDDDLLLTLHPHARIKLQGNPAGWIAGSGRTEPESGRSSACSPPVRPDRTVESRAGGRGVKGVLRKREKTHTSLAMIAAQNGNDLTQAPLLARRLNDRISSEGHQLIADATWRRVEEGGPSENGNGWWVLRTEEDGGKDERE